MVTTRHDLQPPDMRRLKLGKAVYVEKPLALDEDSCRDHRGLGKPPLAVGFNRRFSPHAELIRKYFSRRTTPLMLQYRVNAGIIPKDVWVQNPEIGGGRIIGEGCHFMDFMASVVGSRIVSVSAKSLKLSDSSLSESDNVDIHIQFEDGSLGILQYVALGDTLPGKETCHCRGRSKAVMDNSDDPSSNWARRSSGQAAERLSGELRARLNDPHGNRHSV